MDWAISLFVASTFFCQGQTDLQMWGNIQAQWNSAKWDGCLIISEYHVLYQKSMWIPYRLLQIQLSVSSQLSVTSYSPKCKTLATGNPEEKMKAAILHAVGWMTLPKTKIALHKQVIKQKYSQQFDLFLDDWNYDTELHIHIYVCL